MKPPKEPTKPKKPIPPEEMVNESYSIDLWDHDDERLSSVVQNKFPGISLADLYIDIDYKGYDGGTVKLIRRWQAPNPNYDKEMIKFNKKMEEYDQALKDYKTQKVQYKEQLKAYCQYQLNKLGD